MQLLKCILRNKAGTNYFMYTFRDEGDTIIIRLEDLLDNYLSVDIYPTDPVSDTVVFLAIGLPDDIKLDVNKALDLIEKTLKELTPIVCMEINMRK